MQTKILVTSNEGIPKIRNRYLELGALKGQNITSKIDI